MSTNEITVDEARQAGYNRGRNKASGISLRSVAEWVAKNDECVTYYALFDGRMHEVASEAEEHDRSYTPFEFLAAKLNEQENSDELWSAFEDGIVQGVTDEIDCRLGALEEGQLRRMVEEAEEGQCRPAIVQ